MPTVTRLIHPVEHCSINPATQLAADSLQDNVIATATHSNFFNASSVFSNNAVSSGAPSSVLIAAASATAMGTILLGNVTTCYCDSPVKISKHSTSVSIDDSRKTDANAGRSSGQSIGKSNDILGSMIHSRTGILPLPSQSKSLRLQDRVQQLAKEKGLQSDIVDVVLPNVNHLYNNAEKCQNLVADVTAINHYHERVIAHPEMLEKLRDDWSTFKVDEELTKIRTGSARNDNDEANRIEKSYLRTQYIAECIRLLQRCGSERLFNYNMKYYRDEKDNINDKEDIRSIAPNNTRTPAFLPNEVVVNGAMEEDKDDGMVNDEEESSPVDTFPFGVDGSNMRRFKPHELHLTDSSTKHIKTKTQLLTYERHEIANCDTQYGALLVELIQTGLARSYDLVGKWHCWNRSYHAPTFSHFDTGKSKASRHCSAMILLDSSPFIDGSVGINADYSISFCINCFIKDAKKYRVANRKSGMRFTHDAQWLKFESMMDQWREKQKVKKGDHFIPRFDLLGGLTGFPGMSTDAVLRRWKLYTGLGEYANGTTYKKLENWQIESLKKHGIFLDDDNYKRSLQENANKRHQDVLASQAAKLSASMKSRWGKGKKKKQKTI